MSLNVEVTHDEEGRTVLEIRGDGQRDIYEFEPAGWRAFMGMLRRADRDIHA